MKMMDGVKAGDTRIENKFILDSLTVARRCVRKFVNKWGLQIDDLDMEAAALDAVSKTFDRIKRYLVIKTSYPTYLYLQCKHELLTKTGGRKLEEYCRQNGIDFFSLPQENGNG